MLRSGPMMTLLAAAAWLAMTTLPADAARRVALVVGNGEYVHSPPLTNTRNDAEAISAELKQAGFEVTTALDQDKPALRETLDTFYEALTGADAALFFYAGHGMQFNGVNYIVPVDARLTSPTRVSDETVALDELLEYMQKGARLSLVFLDACRDNPLAVELQRKVSGASRTASVSRGLGRVNANPDSLVVFAASAGKTAADGDGQHSPFTTALLKHMLTPDIEVDTMLRRVGRDVVAATDGAQVPERWSKLNNEFYFKADASGPPQANRGQVPDGGAPMPEAAAGTPTDPKPEGDVCAVDNPPIFPCLAMDPPP